MDDPLFFFRLTVLIFSIIIHEISHGYIAEYLGDPTARLAGRLTLNPIKHIDLFGSILLPGFLALTGHPIFGWAKPVPYNPYNLKDPQKGGGLIALAGPLSNMLIAIVFGLCMRFLSTATVLPLEQTNSLLGMFGLIVAMNVLLALFNLVPIPPIDGSKVLALILPRRWQFHVDVFWARVGTLIQENYFIAIMILFIFISYILDGIFFFLRPIMEFLFMLFTGFPL